MLTEIIAATLYIAEIVVCEPAGCAIFKISEPSIEACQAQIDLAREIAEQHADEQGIWVKIFVPDNPCRMISTSGMEVAE